MFDTLFTHATIVTMNNHRVFSDAFCGITNGKIAFIGDTCNDTAAKRTIDCTGKVLLPGLINAHAHTAMTLLRGYADDFTLQDWLFTRIFPAEAKLDSRCVTAGFALGVAEMLKFGTTSFCDMYYYQDASARIANSIGIRAMLSNGVIAFTDDYDFYGDRSVTEIVKIMQLCESGEFSNLISPQFSIHCERTSKISVWKKAVAFCKEHNLTMHIHLAETQKDVDECIAEHGVTPAKILEQYGVFDVPTIAAHCVHLTENDMDILAKHNVSAIHCPVSNLKLASGIADIVKMREHGVNVCIGTDGCASNNTLDMFEDIKLAALLAKNKSSDASAFSAYNALELATTNGAKAQGMQDKIGKLAEGFDADIIMLDMSGIYRRPIYDVISSIVYCLGGNDVCLTMVHGNILYENGIFSSIDMNNVLSEVENYAYPIITAK